MKQKLRKLKLYEMGIAEWPYDTPYQKMKEVIDRNLEGYSINTSDEYPNSYFFMQGDRYILEQDQKNNTLWVRRDGFWSIFSNDFSLQYADIQTIIKFLVEQHLRSKVGTPIPVRCKVVRSGGTTSKIKGRNTPIRFVAHLHPGGTTSKIKGRNTP